MKLAQPIIVAQLFPEMLEQLLTLLSDLTPSEWEQPTVCAPWTVKEVAQHLLADDVGILSRRRDGYTGASFTVTGWNDLVTKINAQNDLWVAATRRISPQLLCDLLALTGPQVSNYFQSLDGQATGGPVSWAGPDPAPVWLDLAREYTERWHHQQHIRDAVGRPGLNEPRYLHPVLDAFLRAWPYTYRSVDAPEATVVALTITGDAGGWWFLVRQEQTWRLYLGVTAAPQAEVILPQDVAWRLFTKGLTKEEARPHTTIRGDVALGEKTLEMVSIIA